jgi:hypothetical protein
MDETLGTSAKVIAGIPTEDKTDQAAFFVELEARFTRCTAFESEARQRFVNDFKFANADSENNWQWEDALRQDRELEEKPYLTINKTRQHNLQIINDARQNKPGIAMRPTGGGASYKAAEAIGGITRYIEYHSNAQRIYDAAMKMLVDGGVGYWRVITDYCTPDSFDQDIRLKSIADPLCVFIDPDAREPDRSDMNFAFIFESKNKDEAAKLYPEYQPGSDGGFNIPMPDSPLMSSDDVVISEYFRRIWQQDTLYRMPNGQTIRASTLQEEGLALLDGDSEILKRPILVPIVEWYLVVGRTLVDAKVIPGKYVPVVQICAEEIRIEGKLDRKSHTRALKDPQRMYNYWASSAVEYGALQTKSPWVGPAAAFEGHDTVWDSANTENRAYLPYNQYDDQGQKLDPPQRVAPPMSAPVALEGMKISQLEMMLVSGQYQNEMGQQGNERTGAAINARQRQGDNATYHYIDALAIGLTYTGKIILDMLPVIYDTERIIMILGKDQQSKELKINPEQKQAYTEKMDSEGKPTEATLNPKVGLYEVQADVGPGYATQRQEAFNAFSLILTQNPTMAAIIGDIMLRAGDFPLADEAAERLRRLVPKEALGEGPSKQESILQQQVQTMQGTIQALMDQLVIAESKLVRQAEKTGVEKYKALTERLKAILDSEKSADEVKLEVLSLLSTILGASAQTEASPDEPQRASDPTRPLGNDGGMLGQRFMSGQ